MAKLTRKQLAEVFPNHELIKAFERIDEATDATFPAEIAVAQATADAALNLATGQALGVFDPRERVLNLRAVDGVNVTQDAAGHIFSIDLGFVINAAKAFLSHTFQVTAEAIRYALGYTPAPTDSPNFTGVPTAPTAAFGTDTTQIATTAFVQDVVTTPAFSAYQSTLQSVSSGAFTKVQLQSEEFDTNSNFDSTTNYRFTPTVAGYYLITGTVNFVNSVSFATATIYKNGAEFKRGTITGSAAASGFSSNVAALVHLNGSTDYVELYTFQNSGSAQDTATGAEKTYFQAHWARAA